MKNAMVAALVVFIFTTSATVAEEADTQMTGADFLSACSKPDPEWIGFCHGYVQAVFDGMRRPGEDFCPPTGTARAVIVDTVVRHLLATPDLQRLNAASIVYAVLLKSFPCR